LWLTPGWPFTTRAARIQLLRRDAHGNETARVPEASRIEDPADLPDDLPLLVLAEPSDDSASAMPTRLPSASNGLETSGKSA